MKTHEEKLARINIRDCADEPIHKPSFVQSFGFLLVYDSDLIVTHVSENLIAHLNLNAEDILGQKLANFEKLESLTALRETSTNTIVLNLNGKSYNGRRIPSYTDGYAIELTEVEEHLNAYSGAMSKFQSGDALQELYDSLDKLYPVLLNEVAENIACERVMIYQFDDNWHGKVVAEICPDDKESYLGLMFPASDIPPQARELYLKSSVRYIEDSDDNEAEILSLNGVGPIDLSLSDIRGTSPFHIQYLKNMGVRGSLSLSIIVEGQLWGLVSCHRYSSPFKVSLLERINLRRLSQLISIAIERQLAHAELELQETIEQIFTHRNLQSFLNHTRDTHLVSRAILTCLQADGLLLIRGEQFFHEGQVPEINPFEMLEHFGNLTEPLFIENLKERELPKHWHFGQLAGLAILPITKSTSPTSSFSLLLFREEEVCTIRWGGKPTEKSDLKPDSLLPRNSFAMWEELRKECSARWTHKDQIIGVQLINLLKEAALTIYQQEQMERDELIENSVELGIWTLDVIENYLYWNKGMFAIHGIDEDSFSHSYDDWRKLLAKEDRDRIPLIFEQCLQRQKPFRATFTINNPIKGARFIKAQASYVYGTDGSIVKVIGTNVDITDEMRIQRELLEQKKITFEANKLATLGELTASIGHEINNPLAIISNNLKLADELLNSEQLDKVLLKERINQSMSASERIRKIVLGMRTMVRQSEGEVIEIDVAKSCSELVSMLQPLYSIDHVDIDLSLGQGELYIEGDLTQFQQVLINLIGNAKDAMEQTEIKRVCVSAESEDDRVVIKVRDTGTGIPEAQLSSIFDSFFTTKPMGKGTGIGLSVVRSIIRAMNGEIHVTSTLGEGTEFVIVMPRVEHSEPLIIEEESMSEVQVQTECHCLLVDDEEPLRKVLALQLEMEGINVKQAASAEEALVLFGRDEFDVLITDSNMPGLSGEQLLERITQEASGNLPVRFLMTGDVTQELESINANAVIADQLLFKPFETDELIKEIHSRLNP